MEHFTNIFAAVFGVTAALLLVGGSIALRLQRQSQRFALMKAAIDKGITRLPGGSPFWLVSMRQGVVAVALGIGLLLVGGVGAGIASRVPPPTPSTQPSSMREMGGMRGEFGPPPRDFEEGPPGPGQGERPRPEQGPGPGGNGPRGNGPSGREQNFRGEPPRPPMPDLPTQRWHFAQMQMAVSLGAIACGIVLAIVGLARILFARVEKRHEKLINDEVV